MVANDMISISVIQNLKIIKISLMENPTFKFFYFVNPKKYINLKIRSMFFSIKTFEIIHEISLHKWKNECKHEINFFK